MSEPSGQQPGTSRHALALAVSVMMLLGGVLLVVLVRALTA